MAHLFVPDMYIQNYQTLNLELLKNKGIKLLICDIDNTLVPHDVKIPQKETIEFINKVKHSGLQICIISNNTKNRVEEFCKDLNVPYVYSARKPLHKGFRQIKKKFHLEKHEMAMMGDQLLTDILGANSYGCFTILATPLVVRDITVTKINRRFENMVFHNLEKNNKFRRGEYYE